MIFAAACTPSAQGVCNRDAECKSDERCTSGLCIKLAVLDGNGGDPGNGVGGCIGPGCITGLRMISPAAGQFVGGTIHIVATVSAPAAPDSVIFGLGVDGGTELGTAAGVPGASSTYSADLAVTPAFEGSATLTGTLKVGAATVPANPLAVKVDRTPPSVTGLVDLGSADYVDGGAVFYSVNGSALPIFASIDAGAGAPLDAGSIAISWPGASRSVAFDAAKPLYTFNASRSAGLSVEGPVRFTVSASDLAGNTGTGTLDLNFDDVPPQLPVALQSPAGWVARTLADGGANAPLVSLSVVDNGTGVDAVTAQAADAGVATTLAPLGTSIFGAAVGLGGAPAGVAGNYPIGITAADKLQNKTAPTTYNVQVDDAPPGIVVNNTDPTWYGFDGGYSVRPQVTINDQGSGTVSATFSYVASDGGTVSVKAALASGDGGSGSWLAAAALPLPTDPRESPFNLNVTAQDAVGNGSANAAGVILKFDNVAPVISNIAIVTAADGTANGKSWYRGPSASPPTANLDIAASITDGNLVTSGNNAPAVVVGNARFFGLLNSTDSKWHFPVPRSIGAGAASTGVTLTFYAQDAAQNIAPSNPTVVYFDDAGKDTFQATVPADATWYSRNATGGGYAQIGFNVTLPSLPTSGISGITLLSGPKPIGTCTAAGACLLDATNAAAGAEAALAFSVVATSVVGITSTTTGTRNVDDVPPQFDTSSAILYPPADTGPLGWSHDNSHFNLRDSGKLFTFLAWDCGAGIDTSTTPAFSVGGNPPSRAVSQTVTASTHACSNGVRTTTPVVQYVVSSGFGGVPRGSYPLADNAVPITVTSKDLASGKPNAVTGTASVAVTRRLWHTIDGSNYMRIGLGPSSVIAGADTAGTGVGPLVSLDKYSGTSSFTFDPSYNQFFSIGTNGTNPVVFYLRLGTLQVANLTTGARIGNGCSTVPSGSATITNYGLMLTDASDAVAATSWSYDQQSCNCSACVNPGDCGTPANGCGTCGSLITSTVYGDYENLITAAGTCSRSSFTLFSEGQSAIARNGNLIATNGSTLIAVTPAGATAGSISLPGSGRLLLAALGSVDAVIVSNAPSGTTPAGVSRYDYNGSFTKVWTNSAIAPSFTTSSFNGGSLFVNIGNTGAQEWSLNNAGIGSMASGAFAPLVDNAASTPFGYFFGAAAGTVVVRPIDASAGIGATAPFTLPTLPGSVSAMTMSNDGILYVASGGVVHALLTDSSGVDPGAWSGPDRDSCLSSNLGYTCPY